MKFRHHAAVTVAGVIAFVATIPLVAATPLIAPVLLVPLAVAVWAWRAGTDATASGLRVRALLGQRRLPWSDIVEIRPTAGGRVVAVLADDNAITLPAVRPADLPRLASAAPQTPA